MFPSEVSCSDCKIEVMERRWTQLLLKWINKCISTGKVVRKLNPESLADIMAKYSKDVCSTEYDRAMLCTDDIEPFIKYKYPLLRLRYLSEESDLPKRIYIATTVILFHCCMNSQSGLVDRDICRELSKYEQELILKFCENLCALETTLYNVETAIRGAFESVGIIDELEAAASDQVGFSESNDTIAHASSNTTKDSISTLPSAETVIPTEPSKSVNLQSLKFNSSIVQIVLPSVMADTSTYSNLITDSDDMTAEDDIFVNSDEINVYAMDTKEKKKDVGSSKNHKKQLEIKENIEVEGHAVSKHQIFEPANLKYNMSGKAKEANETPPPKDDVQADSSELKNARCLSDCACTRCSTTGPCCGDPGSTMGVCEPESDEEKWFQFRGFDYRFPMKSWRVYLLLVTIIMVAVLVLVCSSIPLLASKKQGQKKLKVVKLSDVRRTESHVWECKAGLCHKAYKPIKNPFTSYSRCSLICMGPQIWPQPIGYTFYSNKIVTLATNKLEYKFQSLPSEAVHQYLAEAFKFFISHLARLEKSGHPKNDTELRLKKMNVQIDVESDSEPRLKLATEESYQIKIQTVNEQVVIKISSPSFCGVRHGLETLSQMILLDQSTGRLITLSNAVVKDGPSHKYRGLMIDTARNYIPLPDLMRTIDAMATVKLNTFHWRISDVTSFPLLLPKLPQLFEYGAYDRSKVYTKEDVKALVNRAAFRGIRVLIEVAAPGPVGRAWSWSPDVSCPTRNFNYTCENTLCLRLDIKKDVFNILQIIYSEILEMTKVDDVFHLSDGIFSLVNCFYLIEEREGFLEKALDRLKQANKGFMPKLPIVWYTPNLKKEYEARAWERMGVQLMEVEPNLHENNYLSRFKVIHSSKWDLSCEMKNHRCRKYKTWQEMYSWKSWRNIEVFTIEGGEAVLWTDLVNSGNLDFHVWPRAAAVAERLWSEVVLNNTANNHIYVRLDSQRWRMLFSGINVQSVWPIWCSFNPGVCLQKLQASRK